MLKTIRNYTLAVLFFGLCLMGFLGPILWPALYEHHYELMPQLLGIPMVQHHVEICTYDDLFMPCEKEIFIV